MRYIKHYVEQMEDEIASAEEYAEKAVECKAKGSAQNSAKFKAMAEDELRHAMFFHELAIKEIEEISKVYTPPVEMLDKWEHEHKEYVERAALIKQMLAM